MTRRPPGSYLLLTRLFLRQFLENDLVSPDSDRSQLLATVGATVVSLTLFISMFASAPYAMSRLVPAQAAIVTLSDKFFYCALAMLVTALVAAAQWDALSLDARDAVILQPLPIRPATLRVAKLTAVAMLGAGVSVAVNIFPTIIFPWMLAWAVPQIAYVQLLGMMISHAFVTVTAAVFGYLVIIAIRESASALLGGKLFAIASPWLQTITIVLLGSAVLLLPLVSARVGQRGMSGWRLDLPPTAFVGVYEVATRGFLAELPRDRVMTKRAEDRAAAFTELYDSRRPLFPALARRAQLMFVGAALIVAIATAINSFRMPAIIIAPAERRRRSPWAIVSGVVFPRSAAARAGFEFAVATMWRNKAHRLTLAGASAVGFAMVLLAISGADFSSDAGLTTRLLVIQPLLYGCLLGGFRHLIRVPAELRANWGFQIAWRGQTRAFTSGVAAAAMLTLALPAILVTMPPVAFAGGLWLAAMHALIGILGAAIVLEVLLLSYKKVPFTCSYVPTDNVKGLGPIVVLAFIIGAAQFARLELAILTGGYAARGVFLLVTIFVILRVIRLTRPPVADIDFNEGPVSFAELRLGG